MKKERIFFKRYLRRKTRFRRGLVEALLVENEDNVVVTLTKRSEAVERRLRAIENGEAREHGGINQPDVQADWVLKGDFDEIKNIMARDWTEELLAANNIKKDYSIVWAEGEEEQILTEEE